MTIEAQLFRNVCLHPEDDVARLVYADWLEENAGLIPCIACSATGYSWGSEGRCRVCHGSGTVSDGRLARAEFIRCQIQLEGCQFCSAVPCHPHVFLRRRERDLLTQHGYQWAEPTFELLGADQWEPIAHGVTQRWSAGNDEPSIEFRRGFVATIATTAAIWQQHGPTIVASMPIEQVTLTDREPWHMAGRCDWFKCGKGLTLASPDSVPLEWWPFLDNPTRHVQLYPSAELAHADLSRAALAWARSLAFRDDAPREWTQASQGR